MRAEPADNAFAIGHLCLEADWAASRADCELFRETIERLAEYVDDPLHCELVALAERCTSEVSDAFSEWARIKPIVFGEPQSA